MNLAEFRTQFPQYNDMPDDVLAQSLHQKYYSDIPFDQFSNSIGLQASVPDMTTKVGPADFAGGVAETIAGPVAQFVTAPVALASGVAEATKPVAGSRIAGTLLNYFTNRLGEKFIQGGERITKPVGEFMAPETQTGKVLSEKLSQVFDYLPEKAGEATYQATESPALATAAKTGAYGLELLAPFFRRAKASEVAQTEAKPSGPSTVAADMQKVRPVTEAVDQSLKAAQAARETTGAKPTTMESAFKQANSIDNKGISVEHVQRGTQELVEAAKIPSGADVSVRSGTAQDWAERMPGMPLRVYEELAKVPSTDIGPAQEIELQKFNALVSQEGKAPETAMRAVWGPELADAPPGLRQAIRSGLAMPEVSSDITSGRGVGTDSELPARSVQSVKIDASQKPPVIPPEKVYAGQVSTVEIKPNAALDPEAKAIETKFAQEIMADPEAAKQRYIQANTNEHGTLVINTDQARELSPDYAASIESRSKNANAVHEPASAIVKAIYADALKKAPQEGHGQAVASYEEGVKLQTEALQGKKAEVIPIRPTQKEPFPTSDQRKVVNLGIGIKPELRPLVEDLGKRIQATKIGRESTDLLKAGISDVQKGFAPMAEGSPRARAVVKDWANADRLARWQWGQFDELLKKNYTEEELGAMWRAADEENVLRTTGKKQTGAGGIDALPTDQRAVVETLHQYGEELLQRAKAVEMFKGEGLPYWAPRMAVIIGKDGEVLRAKGGAEGGTVGRNVTTSAPSLKHRKYLTKEDTEKAMKEKFGEGAKVVENIRTMPLAMSRLERAIAGRELINNIKEIGKQAGEELISESDKPGFFTLDHPSFKTYRPRLSRVGDVNVETNKFEVVKDANGEIVFDKVPLWIAKEFEGPLKAVMSENSGVIYRGLMALKGKTMSIIMYSPIIHNAVEYGRALPASPGKMLSFRMYRDGGAAMRDPELMRQAITDGMVPIGHRYAFQDISGLMEEPTLKEGRSTTAKVAGAVADVVSEEAGKKVRSAVDQAGDVWHNKLLWDQVAKLQAGLYVNIKANFKSKLIEGGLDADKAEAVAGKVAAHFANRYAGAIPNEAMSQWSRKMANMVMFSRSFTIGNIGAMKDAMTGLPRDVQAQIMRDVGELEGAQALKSVSGDVKSMARRKALGIIMMDIAFGIAGNSILQDTLDHLKRDKSLDQIGQGYADRLDALVQRGKESPLEVLNPIGDLEALSSTHENEPGKEERVLWGYDDKGTAIYVRLPTGKIGEEFSGYIDLFTGKADILLRKESTVIRPLQQAILNDVGFGRHLYDPDAKGVKASMKRMGAIVWNFAAQQTPQESIKGAARLAQGKGNDVDFYKVVGPFFGFTFSKGAPGGPAVGVMFKVSRQHSNEIVNIMPDVKQLIEDGDQNAAIEKMREAHMTPQEIRTTLKYAANPGARISPRKMRQFQQTAPEEEKDRMQKLQGQ